MPRVKSETSIVKEDAGYQLVTDLRFRPKIIIDFKKYPKIQVSTIYIPSDSRSETKVFGCASESKNYQDQIPEYSREHGAENALRAHADTIQELINRHKNQLLPAGPGED
jgi:hypothetical protein